MSGDRPQFDASNGRIIVDDIVINVEVEEFNSDGEDTFVAEFSEDRPAKGVSSWWHEDVDAILDFSWHKRDE